MPRPILKKLSEQTISKFISLYHSTSTIGDTTKEYDFVSRNTQMSADPKQLEKPYKANAVTIFVFNKDKTKMLLIKEFRFPINNYVIDSPSGLIDGNEHFTDAALRELYEEIGYTKNQITIESTLLPSYSSVGLTDEQTASVFVTVDDSIKPKQNLEGTEDIDYFWVTHHEAKHFLTYGTLPISHSKNLGLLDEDNNQLHIGIASRTQLALKQFVDKF